MRYYIADCHFYHESLLSSMDQRGFSDVEEMNEYMIKKWNDKVKNHDEVVILGDLSMGDAKQTNEIVDRLHGKLHLIVGNHDNRFLRNKEFHTDRFEWIHAYKELQDDNRKVVLSHYPIMCYNGQYICNKQGEPKSFMLYGHVHDTHDEVLIRQFQQITRETKVTNREGEAVSLNCEMINCFCMYSDYTPLSLDEWIVLSAELRKKEG